MENKKRSLENGKWKKIVNKHNKKLVALALAGTLMGAQIPGNIEQVEASQVSVTSAKTTNSSTFLTAVRRMDNLATIKQMNVKSLGDISDSVTVARSIYDKLPAEAKTDKDVVKWEGYLTRKEKGIANRFVAISRQLPTNNQMKRMSVSELGVARSSINNARKLYNKLPKNVKKDSGVTRWEGYLTSKENTSGATFLDEYENKEIGEKGSDSPDWYFDEDKIYYNGYTQNEEPTEPETPVEPEVPEIPDNLPLPPAGREVGYTEKGNVNNDKNVDPKDIYGHLYLEEYVIPYETVYIENPLLEEGQEELLLEGVNGTELHVYDVIYLGGGAYQRTLVDKAMSQNPINRILVVRQKP